MIKIKDPHDLEERNLSFRKNTQDEALFYEMNLALSNCASVKVESNYNKLPIIYIVGLPRSGTTFLSQLMSKSFDVGYIDNLIARFWTRPDIGITLSKALFGDNIRAKISLSSEHGTTSDPWGPHEFGYFWRHWLRLDEAESHKIDDETLAKVDKIGLAKQLNIMAQTFGKPIVFKNIICGLQAKLLTEVYPQSLFVHIVRNRESVVSSVLKCRQQRYGKMDTWWSIKPSSYKKLKEINNPTEQVRAQLNDTYTEFSSELSKSGVASVALSYELLCNDSYTELKKVSDALEQNFGYALSFVEHPEL